MAIFRLYVKCLLRSASKFLDVMAACNSSIHVFLGRPLFLLSRGTQSIINFGNISSGILLMWPYHCSLLCSMIPMMSGFHFTPIFSFICSYPWYFANRYFVSFIINLLMPNDDYSGRTAPLTSKRCTLYIYSTHISTEYFKHGIYSSFFPLQNAVCFINLTYLVPVLFVFYTQDVLKLKNIIPASKG